MGGVRATPMPVSLWAGTVLGIIEIGSRPLKFLRGGSGGAMEPRAGPWSLGRGFIVQP